jgi:protein tyrosine/serine phosphatase
VFGVRRLWRELRRGRKRLHFLAARRQNVGTVKNKLYRSTLAAALVTLLSAATLAQGPAGESGARYKELPNFHRVSDALYRGGQPAKGGLRRLADLGVKTVVNLRGEDENAAAERREAEALGLRYFSVPMGRTGAPTDEQIARVFEIVDAQEGRPVFVHCQRGSDRTGAVVAAYRIAREGWAPERALEEAEHYGMFPWQSAKKAFIRDYLKRHAATPPAPETGGRKARL